ncbi:MAG: cytochrome B5 [bacterium]|nr:MAG: cytochrome B5 [bacterium]
MKTFTREELAKFDGLEGRKPYVAYLGKVYDMTGMAESEHGDHFGHPFGLDLTDEMDEAPHGDNVIFEYPVVGTYKG